MAHLRLHHVVVALRPAHVPAGRWRSGPRPLQAPPPASITVTTRAAGDAEVVAGRDIDAGRKVFHGRGTRASGHGASLEGSAVAPTLRDHPWTSAKCGTLDAIHDVVFRGVPGTATVSHPRGIGAADARRVATSFIRAVNHGRANP
jgi:hypothetical protein